MSDKPLRLRVANTLFFWLPPESRPGLLRRLAVILLLAPLIGTFQWGTGNKGAALGVSMVYSYAISMCIWTLSDPLRIALRGPLNLPAPSYWSNMTATWIYMGGAILVGYALGTLVGDQYSGHDTFALLTDSPWRFMGFLGGSIAISVAILSSFYVRERSLSLQRQASEARLKLLETQLEPHMLFNTLSNLRALIAVDPPRAIDMVDRLNAYLRATLAASRVDTSQGQTQHTLSLEFQRLDDYLAIMAVRMGPRLRHTLTLPDALRDCPVPPLLLQPLVENAIRHGLEPAVQGGELRVSAEPEAKGRMVLTVSDTGTGCSLNPFDAPPPEDGGSHFGLAQVRERLETAYPGEASIEWDSAPDQGTSIRISLPCHTYTSA
ncbi:histidine kinase [Hydrogenophaga sp. 5NK40-0174]|uniref:sensor histidine kinase n=1 Tax=Hydrogenophaga sp. 5NK40-0174 TaxID=3127649 RepID=UPI003106E66A